MILTEPVKDKEHGGAKMVVRKTLICSPELTCTISKNTSVAGIRKSVCDLLHSNIYQQTLDFLVNGIISKTNIQYNTKITSIDNNTMRNIHGVEK